MTGLELFYFPSDIKIKLTKLWALQNVKRKTISTKRLGKYKKKNIRQKDVRLKICNAMNSFILVSDGGKRRSKRDA